MTTMETVMAKGEQKGNREKKKPKQEKPKAPVATSSFAPPAKDGAKKK